MYVLDALLLWACGIMLCQSGSLIGHCTSLLQLVTPCSWASSLILSYCQWWMCWITAAVPRRATQHSTRVRDEESSHFQWVLVGRRVVQVCWWWAGGFISSSAFMGYHPWVLATLMHTTGSALHRFMPLKSIVFYRRSTVYMLTIFLEGTRATWNSYLNKDKTNPLTKTKTNASISTQTSA